ncbi:MAG TPA: MutS2/Smr-associated SH3 domain-containing protein [Bacteroidia bacterium]
MFVYPKDTGEKLEFDQILMAISGYARLKSAKELSQVLRPYKSYDEAKRALLETGEMLQSYVQGLSFPDISCPEVGKEIQLLKLDGSVLDEKQCLAILAMLEAANGFIRFMRDKKTIFPTLSALCEFLEEEKQLPATILSIIDEHGLVRSSASPQLASIRKELQTKRRENERIFQSILSKLRKAGVLADIEESFMNGRRVVSIVSESKREVRGVIHGSSQTGKATFIEPGETVEINNEIISLESDERQEIRRILRELTKQLRNKYEVLKNFFDLLVHLDFTRAKTLLARELDANVPHFQEKPIISIVNGRHPILVRKNRESGKEVVPLSLHLDNKKSILIISGPNAGGKSIALKTIGLSQLMIQSGIPVCCEPQSEFGFFTNIMTDIGDSQSIEYELSTYSSRLIKMRRFVERAGKNTLFLIDEFGTGTDPELGGAMAEVILEELANSKSYGIITTHYGNIKIAGEELKSVQNACMLFDDRTLEPMYKIEIGKPGSSYTFVIAEKSGIPRELINRAKEKVDSNKVKLDHILNVLQKRRNDLNDQIRKTDALQKELEEQKEKTKDLEEKLKKRLSDIKERREDDVKWIALGKKLADLSEKWEKTSNKKEVIADFVKLMGKEKARITEEKKRLAKENTLEKILERKRKIIVVGAEVRMTGTKQKGTVIEITGNKARVEFGMIKSVISLENLELA